MDICDDYIDVTMKNGWFSIHIKIILTLNFFNVVQASGNAHSTFENSTYVSAVMQSGTCHFINGDSSSEGTIVNLDEASTSVSNVIKAGTFRLINGDSSSEGRVEYYYDGIWGTVCGDIHWDIRAADMVCRSLGFQGAVDAPRETYDRKATGTVWFSNVVCPIGASSLHNCTYKRSCHSGYDAGVECSDCQMKIGGIFGVNCKSCSINGVGRCDHSGCQTVLTYYNHSTKLCEIDNRQINLYKCEDNHKLSWNIEFFDSFTVFSQIACVYLCVMEERAICTGTDYRKSTNMCMLHTVNKYTVPKENYLSSTYSDHCVVGLCPPGQAMTLNKTCLECPVNHFKSQQGVPCQPCKHGYDTHGMTGATECRKICAAGSYSSEGFYCETCPVDTYKNRNDGSKCIKCPISTTTGGKIGQTQCESQFQHYMNEYGFYYIGVLSGFLAVSTCCWNIFKHSFKRLYSSYKQKSTDAEIHLPSRRFMPQQNSKLFSMKNRVDVAIVSDEYMSEEEDKKCSDNKISTCIPFETNIDLITQLQNHNDHKQKSHTSMLKLLDNIFNGIQSMSKKLDALPERIEFVNKSKEINTSSDENKPNRMTVTSDFTVQHEHHSSIKNYTGIIDLQTTNYAEPE